MGSEIQIGFLILPIYPLSVLVAGGAGIWFSSRRAEQFGLDGDHFYNAALYTLVSGLLGAKIWFILYHWAEEDAPFFSLSPQAFSLEEGCIVAGLVLFIYLHHYHIPYGLFFDVLAPGLLLALMIAHSGAFLSGIQPGVFAEQFGGRHPVQLYIAFACLIIGIVLSFTTWRPWPTFQFWLGIGLYSLARFFLEIFRANPRMIGSGYLVVQVVALGTIILVLAVMAYHFTDDDHHHLEKL